jgi:hypothetical protein
MALDTPLGPWFGLTTSRRTTPLSIPSTTTCTSLVNGFFYRPVEEQKLQEMAYSGASSGPTRGASVGYASTPFIPPPAFPPLPPPPPFLTRAVAIRAPAPVGWVPPPRQPFDMDAWQANLDPRLRHLVTASYGQAIGGAGAATGGRTRSKNSKRSKSKGSKNSKRGKSKGSKSKNKKRSRSRR